MRKYLILLSVVYLSLNSIFAEEIDLKKYMELVEKNSKDLKIAEITQNLAETQVKLARSAIMPMVAGSVSYDRNIFDITSSYPVAVSGNSLIWSDIDINSDNDFTFALAMEQQIFNMTIFKALDASKKYRELTGTIHEATRQAILTSAKQLYYQTVLLEEVYNVKKATELNAFDSYLDVQKRFDSDMASELEVLQAEVNYQINIPETTKAARNRDLAMSNLKHLAGFENDTVVVLTDSLEMVPNIDTNENIDTIISNRPDYMIKKGEIELKKINISAQKAEFYPSVSASASFGSSFSNDEFVLEDGTDFFELGIGVTIPLFYGGSRFAKMEKARLELEESKINLSKKQDDIRIEINNLNLLLDEASSRIISAETTVNIAEKAFEIMEVSSRNGMATQLDQKDARLNLSAAKLNYYSAIYDYLNAYFKWQQAVGEGGNLPF